MPRHKQVVGIAHRPAMLAVAWDLAAAVIAAATQVVAAMKAVAATEIVATEPQIATRSLRLVIQMVCQRAGVRIVKAHLANVAIEMVGDDVQDATELRVVMTDQRSSLVPLIPERVRPVVTFIAGSQ